MCRTNNKNVRPGLNTGMPLFQAWGCWKDINFKENKLNLLLYKKKEKKGKKEGRKEGKKEERKEQMQGRNKNISFIH